MLTYEEVRHFLAAETPVASATGVLIERLREGRSSGSGNIKQAQMREECDRLRQAQIIRCIDGLAALASIRHGRAHFSIPDIRKFARKANLGDGETVVRVLKIYERWSLQWPEKGLAEVYKWARHYMPKLPGIADGDEGAQAFRIGCCPDARKLASALVADAHVALGEWVRIFVKREEAANDRRRFVA